MSLRNALKFFWMLLSPGTQWTIIAVLYVALIAVIWDMGFRA